MPQEERKQHGDAANRPRIEVGELHRVCGRTVGIVLALDDSVGPLVVPASSPEGEPVVCLPAHGGDSAPRCLQVYEGLPAVCVTLESMRRSQMTEVFVVVAPSMSDDVSIAVNSNRRKGNGATSQIVEVDSLALEQRTREFSDFEMLGVPFGVLEVARALGDSALDGYDNVVLVDADNVRVETVHYYELCKNALEHPEAEALEAPIEGLEHGPILFTREFLQDIEKLALQS